MTSSPSKADLRRHFRQLRSRHLPPLQQWLDRGAPGLGHPLLQPRSPGAPGERAVGLAWPLALPAVAEKRLCYRPWSPGQPLVADACGIPAPPASAGDLEPHQLALLLIPALAIDRHGVRLGYGGGWYDRLRADPAWRRRPALAVLPEACVVAELPRDPWDVPLDGWISERGWRQLVARP